MHEPGSLFLSKIIGMVGLEQWLCIGVNFALPALSQETLAMPEDTFDCPTEEDVLVASGHGGHKYSQTPYNVQDGPAAQNDSTQCP